MLLLAGTYVTDLEPIKNCTNLMELSLSNFRSDYIETLKHLTNMKYLSINNQNISEEQKKQLKEALPDVNMNFYTPIQ